jgi:hypothetical protein
VKIRAHHTAPFNDKIDIVALTKESMCGRKPNARVLFIAIVARCKDRVLVMMVKIIQ